MTGTVNGLVQIGRSDGHGGHAIELLDYEHARVTDRSVIFKCYDTEGRTVYIHIDKDTMIEAVIGDLKFALPDPNDDEPGGPTT
jgi:hypothetical protein